MGIASGLAVYFMIWWTVIFVLLPVGVKRHDGNVPGVDPGAPQESNIKKKLVYTTLVSGVLWLVVYALVASDISFRVMAERMPL